MIMGLGAVYTYYSDAPPDAETLAQIAAGGGTVQYVSREESAGLAYDSSGQAVPDSSAANSDPYLAGGGNPLYSNPANIPPPPPPALALCGPTDLECIQRNQQLAADNETLRMAYMQALNGAYDPTAPDRYVALLNQYYATGSLPATVRASSAPLNVYNPPTLTAPPPAKTPAPSGGTPPPAQPPPGGTPAKTPVIQPTVSTGGKAATVPDGTAPTGVPSWVWLAAAGAGALLFLGGRR